MRTVKLVRAWACYWLLMGIGRTFPRRWQNLSPLWDVQMWAFQYGAWWAFRQNPNLPDDLRDHMKS
jgi:hypothetical protein